MAEEFSSNGPAEKIEVRAVKKTGDLKPFLNDVKKEGMFTFLIEGGTEDGLFADGTIFVMTRGGCVYSLAIANASMLKQIFENKEIGKATYNVKDMLKALSGQNITLAGQVFDVMLAGYLLGASQSSFELSNLAWNYLKSSISEDQKGEGEVQAVERLHALLLKELNDKSLKPLFDDI